MHMKEIIGKSDTLFKDFLTSKTTPYPVAHTYCTLPTYGSTPPSRGINEHSQMEPKKTNCLERRLRDITVLRNRKFVMFLTEMVLVSVCILY